jgi:aminoglycoside phosphotransferase
MHRAIADALTKDKLSLSIVGTKLHGTVVLAFSQQSPFPVWVAKIAGKEIEEVLKGELQRLELIAPYAEQLGAPKVVSWNEDAGSDCLILSGADGFSEHFGLYVETRNKRDEHCLNAAFAWLKRFRGLVPASELEAKLGPPEDLAWLSRQKDERLARLYAFLKNAPEFPKAPSHGDFWCGNMLFHDGKLGVIDWEALAARHALHDVFSLLTHCAYRAGTRVNLDVTPARFLDLYFSESTAANFVRETVTALEPDPATQRLAFYHFVTFNLRIKGGRYRESWLEILKRLDQSGFPGPWSK